VGPDELLPKPDLEETSMARGSNSPRQPLSVKKPAKVAKKTTTKPAEAPAAPKTRKTSKTYGL